MRVGPGGVVRCVTGLALLCLCCWHATARTRVCAVRLREAARFACRSQWQVEALEIAVTPCSQAATSLEVAL